MTILTIKKPYRNIDETSLQDNLWLLSNCYLDEGGAIRKMPGLSGFVDVGTNLPIDGLYWWDAKSVIIIVSGGNIYKVTSSTGSFEQIGSGGEMAVGTRVVFSEIYDLTANELRLFMANGLAIRYTNGSTVSVVSGGIAPTRCTHIAGLDTYLIANDLDSPYEWKASAVENPTSITQSYVAQAESDEINALFVASKRIYVCGRRSIEVFYNSGDTVPFRTVGVTISPGIIAPYAYAIYRNAVFVFTSNNEFGLLDGYSFKSLMVPYARRIQGLSYLNDVEIDRISSIGGRSWIMVNFIDGMLSVAYDIETQVFSERGTWDGDSNNIWTGRGYAFTGNWNLHVVGDRSSGIVYKLSESYTTDNGNPIHCEIITGNYSMGTIEKTKYSDKLTFNLLRGIGKTSDQTIAPKAYLQVRDNFQKAWSMQFELDLGALGDTWVLSSLNGMGSYRTRQYRIIMQDDAPFILNWIEETLRNAK